MQQLSAEDAQFLYLETNNNFGYITSVCVYDPSTAPKGKVSYKEFLRHVQARLHLSRLFTQRIQRVPMDLDFPYWVTDQAFDFKAHMSYASLPRSARWREFCDLIGHFHSEPLNMERPLWAMKMIDGLGQLEEFPPSSYAIVTKVHHCAIDGASGVRFLTALSDADVSGTPFLRKTDSEATINKPVSLFSMMSNAYENNLSSPVRVADSMFNAFPSFYPMVKSVLTTGSRGSRSDEYKVPPTRFNQPTSANKVFDRYVVLLSDLRKIRSLVKGATVNDVVLAVCSGGLRRYLQYHDDLPAQSLVAWAPINARPKRTGGRAAGGNHLEAMTVLLYTNEPDPRKRLASISAFTELSKQGKSGASVRVVTSISKQFPGFTLALASRLVAKSGVADKVCNVFVSNVSGPKRPIYMNGAKCIDVSAMAPLAAGMGLFIATPGYNGRLTFSITSTDEILPDISFFIQCLQQSFAELVDMVTLSESSG